MYKKSCFWVPRLLMPGQQLRLISMSGKSTDGVNTSAHRNLFTKNTHLFSSVNNAPRKGALRRITDKHHAVFMIPQIMFQVMSNAPPCTHTGTGHDHRTAIDLIDSHRLSGFTGEMQAG